MTQKMLQSDFSRSDKNQNQSKLLPHAQAPHMTNDKSRSSLSIRLRQQFDPVEAASKPRSTRPQPTPSGSRRSTSPQPIFSGPRNSKPVTSPVEAKKVPTNIDLSAIINYTHR